jgi:hypothetical protein
MKTYYCDINYDINEPETAIVVIAILSLGVVVLHKVHNKGNKQGLCKNGCQEGQQIDTDLRP